MDEQNLKKVLQNQDIGVPDPNAKKRAVNLAVAAFKEEQQKKQNSSQGVSLLSRLTGRTTQNRRTSMERKTHKRLMYGGMATAMAVVLIAGVSFQQLQNFDQISAKSDLSVVPAGLEITAPPGTTEAVASYIGAVKEEDESRIESPVMEGTSSLPTPTEVPVGRVTMEEEKKSMPGSRIAANSTVPTQEVVSRGWAGAGGVVAASPPMAAMDSVVGGMIAPGYYPYPEPSPYYQEQGRDKFEAFKVNPIKVTAQEPVSTFSIDVDTSSYSFARRQLNSGVLPQADAVRVEEMVNYFDYNWPAPETKEQPFKASVAVTDNPWAVGKKLITVGIKGYEMGTEHPRSNLVFLLDVSGSMNEPTKLPLVKASMKMLLDQMRPDDTISIAVYAGAAGTVLEPTKISDKQKIINAIDNLSAGGGTAGAQGIALAYQLAEQTFDKNAVNRVILATDGDFNVGVSDPEELKKFVEQKRKTGVFLSVLGFGQGNLNDEMMQKLAQNGNGAAAYIDTLNEARKVLVEEASSTLFPIAKDVKIQVEFNPAKVAEYRLVGYETRHLNREDFNNDAVDAGDIGAGHTVTAIYEITPVGGPVSVDPLRYGAAKPEKTQDCPPCPPGSEGVCAPCPTGVDPNFGGEIAFLKIRYKLPSEDVSKLITTPITENATVSWKECAEASGANCGGAVPTDITWASAVAAFGQKLKGESWTANFSYDDVIALAQKGKGEDASGYRAEFINLVRLAKSIGPANPVIAPPVQPMPPVEPQPVPMPQPLPYE